ncbi:MAG: hypothetical protein ABIR96_10860 [Bdellovibrionota bacterium]
MRGALVLKSFGLFRLTLAAILIFSYTPCRASEAECKEWIFKNLIKPRAQGLKRDIVTYHWAECKNVQGYTKGKFKNVGPAYVKSQLGKRKGFNDMRAGGFYVASDPSSSCGFAKEEPCLVVSDIAKGSPIDFSSYTDATSPMVDAMKLLQWDCFEPTYVQRLKDEGMSVEQSITWEALRPINGKSLEDLLQIEYETSPSLSYPYSNQRFNNVPNPDGARALRLRNDLEGHIQSRFYERQDLTNPSTPELKNIVTHLSGTALGLECLRKFSIPKIDYPLHADPSFETWLNQVVSEKDFSEVVQDAVIVEKQGSHH